MTTFDYGRRRRVVWEIKYDAKRVTICAHKAEFYDRCRRSLDRYRVVAGHSLTILKAGPAALDGSPGRPDGAQSSQYRLGRNVTRLLSLMPAPKVKSEARQYSLE